METLIEQYNWQAALLTLAGVIVLTKLLKFCLFQIPALAEMRRINGERDKPKWQQAKYPPIVNATQRVGLAVNLVLFTLVLPFCTTLDSQPVWQMLLDLVVILMVYDFFYYLCHRFWFHGNGWMRRIHAVHHQARSPTYIDALYVHPFETFVGLSMYALTVAGLALLMGPFHVATMVLTFIVYTQLNTLNHTFVDIPRFPFKTASWITAKHHVHHENMHRGNYATITLLYDRLFGTLD